MIYQKPNLYNKSTCYSITVNNSKNQVRLKPLLPLTLSIIASFFLITPSFTTTVVFISVNTWLLFFIQQIISKKSITVSKSDTFAITITMDGKNIIEMNQNLQKSNKNTNEIKIKPQSRIGIMGCWLYLEQREDEFAQSCICWSYFIFKDSLSKQDYSRLARIINIIKKNQKIK